MAGGPGPGRFDDPRLAESLRAGDAIALTKVYDTYAPFLFDYCHGLLRDRVEAAGALRACLVAAREHVGGLREPERLRGWLYAVARKECMRRRDNPSGGPGQEAPEVDDGLSEMRRARRAERRMLTHSMLAALTGRQREVVDLAVRHELDAGDLAGIFGLSEPEAERMLAGALRDLDEAARAVAIAHALRDECPSLAPLTASWPLPPGDARSLVRHVASCPTCHGQQVTPPPADRLLAVLPVAAVPPDLRLETLTTATHPDRAETRAAIAAAVEPFDHRGWPLPYEPHPAAAPERRRRGRTLAAVGGGIAAVALLGVTLTAFTGGDQTTNSAARGPLRASVPSATPHPSSPDLSPSQTPTPTPSSSSPTPTKSATPSKSATPTPSASSTSSTPPGAPATRPPTTTSPPAPPTPGRLAVSGCSMGVAESCAVTITAVDGPVSWRVTGTSGRLRAYGSGQLAAGESTRVRVERTNDFCWGRRTGSVSFAPGGSASVSYC
ncbi:hypothetical protein GCM10009678_33580 [Actinomadura kijaniata]|uniref:DNA-directed RNA polymerase specialized sigma24 family protein n=1 Tax=Actinomadura namibiensis TaxID=182080 RepID=A0A7W3LMV0_ACTNM|nr:sigma-70 family RNA polymerase sigma factor [Actinomadura namibiensis]MBA8951033.1 DNA-directed RNA polymerase specialized sigma24 family protein [Actinomadura namibiensis]